MRLVRISSKKNNAKINRLITQTVQYIQWKYIYGHIAKDRYGGGGRLLDLKYDVYPGWTTRYWSLAKQKGQTRIWILYMKQGNEKRVGFLTEILNILKETQVQ